MFSSRSQMPSVPTQNDQYPPQMTGPDNGNQIGIEEEEEIPLLEDLDIDIEMVKNNLKSVILFKEFKEEFTEDPDMTGPLLVGLSLAMALMLVRKPIFGFLRNEIFFYRDFLNQGLMVF